MGRSRPFETTVSRSNTTGNDSDSGGDDDSSEQRWTLERFIMFLEAVQLGEHSERFRNSRVSERQALLLSDQDFEDMGITSVGDRLRIRAAISAFDVLSKTSSSSSNNSNNGRSSSSTVGSGDDDERAFFGGSSPSNDVLSSPERFCKYLERVNLGEFSEHFLRHKISGHQALILTDDHYREIGIIKPVDRVKLKSAISILGIKARYYKRRNNRTVWWRGTENLYFSEFERFCFTCAGLCSGDPSTYKLTPHTLTIKTIENPCRCGPIRFGGCCCYCWNKYKLRHIDLSKVDDIDRYIEGAPPCLAICCCAPGKDHVQIQTFHPEKKIYEYFDLVLEEGDGKGVCSILWHQVEEAQRMERS